ncbi:phage tail tape measure protein [Hymenobacter guriensis]|uniref:Phage tail tape measure protein n=1 Tax=Hymenobacter guriensis TaxID=2793065 RepID=A0ABS0L961_9BACT|nr:phage tail tape measure protein [Hymenobacter guriensis]MBG8556153.1 phage tail tape measure protein [Hymenobacter guriensis]
MDAKIDLSKYIVGGEAVQETANDVNELARAVSAFAKGLEANSKRIQNEFAAIRAAAIEVRDKGNGLNLVNDADIKALRELFPVVEKLRESKRKLKEAEAGQAGLLKETEAASKQLTSALREQQAALKKSINDNDIEAAKKYAAQILTTKNQAQLLTQALKGANTELTAASGSYNALVLQTNKLRAELRALDTGFDSSSEHANKLKKQIADNTERIIEFDRATSASFRNVASNASRFSEAGAGGEGLVKSFVAAYFGIEALANGIGQAVDAAVGSFVEFEKAQSSLSALTGASGEDLKFYAEQANRIGPAMGKSGAEVLAAFEKIGSAQPALLKNKNALAAVTEQALLLAAASGEDLAPAAEALTGVMNQFLAPAAEAGRYVNALAAGAKEGAATIPQAAASMKYFGTNAASANTSIEQSVALIQVLAERSIKGEQAGVNLRNVFAKLASGARDTNPEIVGLDKALDNLGKKNLSTAEYTKLFGLENSNAAKILVDGRDKVKSLTIALTGTQTASEQAARQLDNTAVAGNRLVATAKAASVAFIAGVAPAVRSLFNGLSGLIGRISGVTKSFEENLEATGRVIAANQAQGRSAQALLTRYEELTANGLKPTAAEKKELDIITLKLRDSLGQSVVSIEKETGALVLNKDAVRDAIKQRLLLANQTAGTLALQANTLKEQAVAESAAAKGFQRDMKVRQDELEQLNLRVSEFSKFGSLRLKFDFVTPNANNAAFSKEQQAAQLAYVDSFNKRNSATAQATEATQRYNATLKQLADLGFSAADVQRLFGIESAKAAQSILPTDEDTESLDENTEALNRNAKALAERRKAELELSLAQMEQTIARTKQFQQEQAALFSKGIISRETYAEAVAGTEDIINDAQRRARDIRIEISKQETAAQLAEVNLELARIKKRRKVTNEEINDAEQAAANRRVAITLSEKAKQLKILAQYEKDVVSEPIDPVVPTIDTRAFLKGQKSIDQINDDALKRMREYGEKVGAENDLRVQRFRESEERRREIIQQSVDLAIQAEQALFDFIAQGNQQRIENEEYNRDQAVRGAGDNAELRASIEEQYDKRIRDLKRKAARDEKTQALISVAIQTAVAVAKTISELGIPAGIPFAAIALASGAIQAAVIASQPLPQYFKGRENGPAEWAQVAERGPELIEGRSGGMKLVQKPSVVFLAAGDKVHTAPKTADILRAADARQSALTASSFSSSAQALANNRQSELTPEQLAELLRKAGEAGVDRVVQAIKNQKTFHTNYTDNGIERAIKQAGSLTHYVDSILNRS